MHESACHLLMSIQWLGCYACLGVGYSTCLSVAGLPWKFGCTLIRLKQTVRLHSIWGRREWGGEGCNGGMLCSFVWNQRDWTMLISVVCCIVGTCMHSICHSVSSVRGFTPVHSTHHCCHVSRLAGKPANCYHYYYCCCCCHVSQLLPDAGWHACGLGARGWLKGVWCLHSQEAV